MQSFGPLFINIVKLKHPIKPVFEWGWTQETDHPYRSSKVCLVFWVPGVPRGIAVGLWGERQSYTKVEELMGFREVSKFGNLPVGTKGDDVSEW